MTLLYMLSPERRALWNNLREARVTGGLFVLSGNYVNLMQSVNFFLIWLACNVATGISQDPSKTFWHIVDCFYECESSVPGKDIAVAITRLKRLRAQSKYVFYACLTIGLVGAVNQCGVQPYVGTIEHPSLCARSFIGWFAGGCCGSNVPVQSRHWRRLRYVSCKLRQVAFCFQGRACSAYRGIEAAHNRKACFNMSFSINL